MVRLAYFRGMDSSEPLLGHGAAPRRMESSKRLRVLALAGLILIAIGAVVVVIPYVKVIQESNAVPSGSIRASIKIDEEPRVCEADNGVVASDDERCSIVGRDILKIGGHAVDAAVATALCEGVVNPMASGIGGGAFMLIRLANGSAIAYDMREVAPAAATENMYASNPASKNEGALSAGVPGEIAGLHLAWQHFGRLPWKTLFEPAIQLARHGFVVSSYLEFQIRSNLGKITAHKVLKEMLSLNGTIVKAGDILHNKKLARTLELIADKGPSVYYKGTIGEKLVADVQAAGGILTMEDLKNYKVEVRKPLVAHTLGYTVLGMPPPSSGGATLALILNILANFADVTTASEGLQYHRLIEAFKHAYAVRMNLADPAFVNVSSVVHDMLSYEFARTLQKTIRDNTTFPPKYYGSHWNQLNDHGTCHFGIVDGDRNAVSITTTVNSAFGSKLVSKSTGILLNNEMDDFAIPQNVTAGQYPPANNNFVEPNKRPLSSMSPTIVLQNGQLRAVLGASGGIKIITGVAQVFVNYFVRGMDPLTAVATPRVHHQLIPNQVSCENWTLVTGDVVEVSSRVRHALSSRGHNVVENTGFCVTQMVLHDLVIPATNHKQPSPNNTIYFGKLTGVSDYRKNGSPAGF